MKICKKCKYYDHSNNICNAGTYPAHNESGDFEKKNEIKYTNKNNLPSPVVEMVKKTHQSYNPGVEIFDYSATQLISPPYQLIQKEKYKNNIIYDIDDLLWQVDGTSLHRMLETAYAGRENEMIFTERRLVAGLDGVLIGGGCDLYIGGHIYDLKKTSVWSWIYQSSYDDWRMQLNLYAWLFRKNGFNVEKLSIIAWLRDWQRSKAMYDKNYPQKSVMQLDIDLMSEDFIEDWLRERFGMIDDVYNGTITECTPSERWETPTIYAVKKNGVKKSLKLCDSEEEATEYIANQDNPEKLYIEKRPGQRKRCESYCEIAGYCPAYQQYIAEGME